LELDAEGHPLKRKAPEGAFALMPVLDDHGPVVIMMPAMMTTVLDDDGMGAGGRHSQNRSSNETENKRSQVCLPKFQCWENPADRMLFLYPSSNVKMPRRW
jgi:hypothetical protein